MYIDGAYCAWMPADALERTGEGRLRALEQQLPREQRPVQLTLGQDAVHEAMCSTRGPGYEAAMSRIEDPREAGPKPPLPEQEQAPPGPRVENGAAARLWLRLVRGAWDASPIVSR